nr:retrovirus-related Pol polyprotein from transposon TNT 1-94 [Tanacetum cinerariifolium]
MTIEAIEQGIRGVYENRVEWNRPSVKPRLESEFEYEIMEDGSSDPQDFYQLTGMVHRLTESSGFNYHNPVYSPYILIYCGCKDKKALSFELVSSKGMVKGLDHIDHPNQVCEGRHFGKHARSSFPKESTSRAKEPLQLIHTDLCGLITPPSHAMVEKGKSLKIKSMKSDRGGEFLSKEFNKYCEDNRIQRFITDPYSPQQNGVVERKNRTILNMVRSMLKTKKMPKEFWAEAVDCAIYLLNWCSSKSLDNKTSQEA